MKRCVKIMTLILPIIFLFCFDAKAEDIDSFNESIRELEASLSDEVKENMSSIGIDNADISSFDNVSLKSVLSLISELIGESFKAPLSSTACVIAVALLTKVFESYRDPMRYPAMRDISSAVCALSVSGMLIKPALNLVFSCCEVVSAASGLMMLYTPIMVGMMIFSGHIVSSGGSASMIVGFSELVSSAFSKGLNPLVSVYLAMGVASSLSDRGRLKSLCDMTAKTVRWVSALIMTLFSGILSVRSVIDSAADSVAARAVRFTLSSWIPIVGGAVSEAYKTISSSVSLLRSGAGVFVIAAVFVTFLPLMIKSLMWLLSLSITKCVSDTLESGAVSALVDTVKNALVMLLAVTLSVMIVYIISTALLMRMGGAD